MRMGLSFFFITPVSANTSLRVSIKVEFFSDYFLVNYVGLESFEFNFNSSNTESFFDEIFFNSYLDIFLSKI